MQKSMVSSMRRREVLHTDNITERKVLTLVFHTVGDLYG
jgi:hypothetical protein